MHTDTWRLIITPPATGAYNMALDEALLEGMPASNSKPVLRLYAWEPACLSIGYAQPFADVDQDALKHHGWHLVRRITGGRAILHTDEITYSVITPITEPRMAGSILESYRNISRALLQVLAGFNLSVQADREYDLPSGSTKNAPVCFEVPSSYEITVNERKLIGSAQARKKDGIIQHGTLPLCGDLSRITLALAFPNEEARATAAERLLSHATTLEQVTQRRVSWQEASRQFIRAFEETLNIQFEESALSDAEHARTLELVAAKYAHPDWTLRL